LRFALGHGGFLLVRLNQATFVVRSVLLQSWNAERLDVLIDEFIKQRRQAEKNRILCNPSKATRIRRSDILAPGISLGHDLGPFGEPTTL
jgi:hypothetical protein